LRALETRCTGLAERLDDPVTRSPTTPNDKAASDRSISHSTSYMFRRLSTLHMIWE